MIVARYLLFTKSFFEHTRVKETIDSAIGWPQEKGDARTEATDIWNVRADYDRVKITKGATLEDP